MAISAIDQRAFFIKNLKKTIKSTMNDTLVDHDQSETEDIFVTKENIKPIKSFEKKTSGNGIYYCCDQSETDTILLGES